MSNEKLKRELEERTLKFSVAVINALANLTALKVLNVLVYQLSKSASAIGAIYREANRAATKADFAYKLSLVVKEASETVYWLEVCLRIEALTLEQKEPFQVLLLEARELYALFRSSERTVNKVRGSE